MTAGGNDQHTLISHADSLAINAAFEPYPLPIPYVASTGGSVFGAASSGFLYSLTGDAFNSFLSFTATTPTTATATADPVAPGSQNIMYKLSADAITSIKFVNGFGGGVNAVSIGAGTKQAVVSYNGTTGYVSSVVTVASKRAVAPVISKRGDETILTVAFSGAFNAHGKNVAPSGATQIVLSKTGDLVSAR